MDLDEALKLLKGGADGVEQWNRFRISGAPIPDMMNVDLSESVLCNANLAGVVLTGANLRDSALDYSNLRGAELVGSNLSSASLDHADLGFANLAYCNFTLATLRNTRINNARLLITNFDGSDLSNADFTGATCGGTFFGNVRFLGVTGLDSIHHAGPSTIGIDTLLFTPGVIPGSFLRGCGVPDSFIELAPALIAATPPIQFHSCFISYSAKNTPFAERLYADLREKAYAAGTLPTT